VYKKWQESAKFACSRGTVNLLLDFHFFQKEFGFKLLVVWLLRFVVGG
jgi:hypothetical protein